MKEKLWTKDFISITLVNFFLMLTFYLLMVTISVYAVNEFQSNASAAGFASSIFVIGALVGRLFGGRYMEKLGQKKLLLIGIEIMIVTAIIYSTNKRINCRKFKMINLEYNFTDDDWYELK